MGRVAPLFRNGASRRAGFGARLHGADPALHASRGRGEIAGRRRARRRGRPARGQLPHQQPISPQHEPRRAPVAASRRGRRVQFLDGGAPRVHSLARPQPRDRRGAGRFGPERRRPNRRRRALDDGAAARAAQGQWRSLRGRHEGARNAAKPLGASRALARRRRHRRVDVCGLLQARGARGKARGRARAPDRRARRFRRPHTLRAAASQGARRLLSDGRVQSGVLRGCVPGRFSDERRGIPRHGGVRPLFRIWGDQELPDVLPRAARASARRRPRRARAPPRGKGGARFRRPGALALALERNDHARRRQLFPAARRARREARGRDGHDAPPVVPLRRLRVFHRGALPRAPRARMGRRGPRRGARRVCRGRRRRRGARRRRRSRAGRLAARRRRGGTRRARPAHLSAAAQGGGGVGRLRLVLSRARRDHGRLRRRG